MLRSPRAGQEPAGPDLAAADRRQRRSDLRDDRLGTRPIRTASSATPASHARSRHQASRPRCRRARPGRACPARRAGPVSAQGRRDHAPPHLRDERVDVYEESKSWIEPYADPASHRPSSSSTPRDDAPGRGPQPSRRGPARRTRSATSRWASGWSSRVELPAGHHHGHDQRRHRHRQHGGASSRPAPRRSWPPCWRRFSRRPRCPRAVLNYLPGPGGEHW